jgi:hypothetical protein
MTKIGEDCVCIACFDDWNPKPPTFDDVPMLHEQVTISAILHDPDGNTWVRLRSYPREYGIEAFRPLTRDERGAAKGAVNVLQRPQSTDGDFISNPLA